MMLKEPVTPFTRYSTPASLAVFLVEFMPSLLSISSCRLNTALRCNLLYYVTSGADTASVIMLAISVS
jgi:hypothetical protein